MAHRDDRQPTEFVTTLSVSYVVRTMFSRIGLALLPHRHRAFLTGIYNQPRSGDIRRTRDPMSPLRG